MSRTRSSRVKARATSRVSAGRPSGVAFTFCKLAIILDFENPFDRDPLFPSRALSAEQKSDERDESWKAAETPGSGSVSDITFGTGRGDTFVLVRHQSVYSSASWWTVHGALRRLFDGTPGRRPDAHVAGHRREPVGRGAAREGLGGGGASATRSRAWREQRLRELEQGGEGAPGG